MENDFDDMVALVTGGASGIGLATAVTLAERGARVAVIDLEPNNLPDGLLALRADVSDCDSVTAAVETAVERLGGIDMLVNNAGVPASGTVTDNDDEEWARVLDVNVVGMVRATRAALPHLRRSSSPAIVNTCSVAASNGMAGLALYSASKGAVRALTLAMAADFVDVGIRVNCVSPATVDSPWLTPRLRSSVDPDRVRATLEARQPTKRLVTPQEVADAIVFLASPRAASTTGCDVMIDGGFSGLRL